MTPSVGRSHHSHGNHSSASNSHTSVADEFNDTHVTFQAVGSHHSHGSQSSESNSQTSEAKECYSEENKSHHDSSAEENKSKHNSNSDDNSRLTSESEYCPSSSEWADDTSDEFLSCLESLEAHYLEEEPEAVLPEPQPLDVEDAHDGVPYDHGDGDPEDPDDPEFEGESSSSEDSEDDNIHVVANIHNNRLNMEVQLRQNLTKGEILCLELASAVRHKKTFESLIDHFKSLNLLFGPKCFPESKVKLWSVILLNKAGIQLHVYCGRRACGRYIGRRDRINDQVRCRCGYRIAVNKAKFFITLDLKTQLMYFLSIPGMWDQLHYPQRRQKRSPTAIEDILDGAVYQRLKQEGQPLSNPHNFSCILNLDGVNPTKRGSLKLYPVFIRINELPPELRQKFHFPIAIYVDHCDPNFQAFLKPVVRQLRRLETRGLDWKPDGINEINSKLITIGFNVDSPVRYSILNMSKWDSIAFGCTYCTHQGIRVAGSQRYPEVNLQGIPPFQDRSHQGMINAMIQVQRDPNIEAIEGHKGTSILMLLEHLDLRDGQAEDDLHQDHEGSAADLTELLLTTRDARAVPNMTYEALVQAIDARLLKIKSPSRISRKPRSIQKRGSYNGSEWRNWLLFYSVPCLLGLIKPEYLDILASLSHACYLLSQDAIEPEDINSAERLLLRVARRFEITFGVEKLKYNLHVTTKHKVRSVRNLGSPMAYSTYNFESLNRHMNARVTSPKGAAMQILKRVFLQMTVYASQFDQRLSEDVRLRIEEILNPYQLKGIRQVGPHIYLVGRGVERAVTQEEAQVLLREGLHAQNIVVYKSFLIGNTRYRSFGAQNQNIKSDDSFIYSSQDTFCTIQTVCSFMDDNGEERCGAFVNEHDVVQIVPVARHISILQNANADLQHFITFRQVRCPALKMNIGNVVYGACVPNCFEID